MFKKMISTIKSVNIKHISYNSNIQKYIRNIGDTPIKKLNDNIHIKLEGHNPSGSIKDRPISNMIHNLMLDNKLKENQTICIVSSGSAGYALHNMNRIINRNINIVIAMPLKYSDKDIPSKLIDNKHVNVCYSHKTLLKNIKKNHGKTHILLIDDIFINIVENMKNIATKNKWIKLDQHYNHDCMNTHENTCKEILEQIPDVTDVVCATGTGGTAAGLIKYLPKHIKIHSRPSNSGEIDGLGDVGKYDNFCDTTRIDGYYNSKFNINDAVYYQNHIKDKFNLDVGQSTGASYWLANKIKNKNKKILIISADGI